MAEVPTEPDRPTTAAAGVGPADPLDLWLRRGLRRRFDAVLGEPLPPDLLRRLDEHGRARTGPETGTGSLGTAAACAG